MGHANTGLPPGSTPSVVSLPAAAVTVTGVGIVFTDAAGDYAVGTTLTGPLSVTAKLWGPNYTVIAAQGATLSAAGVTSDIGGNQVANLHLNPVPAEFTTSQTTAAFNHESIRGYVQS